jgi:hypothetical protein
MIYQLRDDTLKGEYSSTELIERYESGSLDGAALVAPKGDAHWRRLDSILANLRREVPQFVVWRPGQST